MNAVEFTTELSGSRTLTVPPEVADQLPRSGRVRVLLLTDHPTPDDVDAAYERGYMRVPEDLSLTSGVLPHLAVDGQEWA